MTNERFGIREEDVAAERDVHKGLYRVGTCVPTREDVRSMAPERLHPILDQWMWESPVLLIPSNAATRAVRQIVADCRRYVTS